VPECPAHLADVHARLEQLHAEGMTEHVGGPVNPRFLEYAAIHLVNRTHRAFWRGLARDEKVRGVAILDPQQLFPEPPQLVVSLKRYPDTKPGFFRKL